MVSIRVRRIIRIRVIEDGPKAKVALLYMTGHP